MMNKPPPFKGPHIGILIIIPIKGIFLKIMGLGYECLKILAPFLTSQGLGSKDEKNSAVEAFGGLEL